jgi:hypothetical protein
MSASRGTISRLRSASSSGPNQAWLLYGNWSRGFKSGTAEIGSTRRQSTTQPLPFVDPEEIEAFEVGVKYESRNFNFNLAGFFQRLKNGQFSLTRPIPVAPFFTSTLTNAAESEALWRGAGGGVASGAPFHCQRLDRVFAFGIHQFLLEGSAQPGPVRTGRRERSDSDLSGNATRMSPRWSLNLFPVLRDPASPTVAPSPWPRTWPIAAGSSTPSSTTAAVAGSYVDAGREHPLSGARRPLQRQSVGEEHHR